MASIKAVCRDGLSSFATAGLVESRPHKKTGVRFRGQSARLGVGAWGAARAVQSVKTRSITEVFSMFRLIKLALYALVGYALYELYQGMVQGGGMQSMTGGGQQSGQGGQGERFGERLNIGGAANNITGGGSGVTERTDEPSGTSTSHAVGRGVIS
jgi:hypothetical protein